MLLSLAFVEPSDSQNSIKNYKALGLEPIIQNPLPLLLIFVIAITLVGQAILDIRHHPYHHVFKF
jgi:hypothetical protein